MQNAFFLQQFNSILEHSFFHTICPEPFAIAFLLQYVCPLSFRRWYVETRIYYVSIRRCIRCTTFFSLFRCFFLRLGKNTFVWMSNKRKTIILFTMPGVTLEFYFPEDRCNLLSLLFEHFVSWFLFCVFLFPFSLCPFLLLLAISVVHSLISLSNKNEFKLWYFVPDLCCCSIESI